MLNERIRQNNQKIGLSTSKQENLKTELRAKLSDLDFDRVCQFTTTAQLNEHNVVKECQIRKFQQLKAVPNDPSGLLICRHVR